MKILALVLFGIIIGLGLVVLPTLGSPSFSIFGSATQYAAGDGKNTTGTGTLDNSTYPPAVEAGGNTVYRSISGSLAGPYGVPGVILALGLAVAAGAYLLIRRSAP